MSDPALAIQRAYVDAIRSVVGNIVYDQTPPADPYPRITVGDGQSIANLADCYDGTETYLDVHVWSRSVGFPEAKGLADQVIDAVNDVMLPLDGHTMELNLFDGSQALRDPDGMTSHIVLSFRILSQPKD